MTEDRGAEEAPQERDLGTGRYVETDWSRGCTCGHQLGEHTAAVVNGRRDCTAAGCGCSKFQVETKEKKVKTTKTPEPKGPGFVTIHLVGYRCRCARCGRLWTSKCDDCPADKHTSTCQPPLRCTGCKVVGWQEPAAWVKGEGTSAESVRRRKVKAIAAKAAKAAAKTSKGAAK